MKTIVIYQSNTGFTQQYAQWIAAALQCESKPLKSISAQTLSQYDTVIFGGWVMGGMIAGLSKLQKMSPKLSAVFAVGATPAESEAVKSIAAQNKLTDLPFFYFEGGFRYDKLNFFHRAMLGMVKKMIAKQPEKDEQAIFMAKVLGTSFDNASAACVQPLVQHITQHACP